MTARPSVAWVLPDKMGGSLNLVANLVRCSDTERFAHHVILTDNLLDVDTRSHERFTVETRRMEYRLPIENLYSVLRRLRNTLPEGDGILVANDWLELAAATAFDTGRAVVQILHGDYDFYYDLAARHDAAVDVFVACAGEIAAQLRRRLPHRTDDIVHLPPGVQVPDRWRSPQTSGPLRLLFVGRVVSGKGVFDLPRIDGVLARLGIACAWTIVGGGPDEKRLREEWSSPRIRYTGALPHRDVLELYPEHDIFVLPSRAEGFPVTLLEAMGAGVVPVITDLRSGVREAIEQGVTGWLVPVADVEGFARAVAALHTDRPRLNRMSAAARGRVDGEFDIATRAQGYERLFMRYAELRRPRRRRLPMPYGSRLDRPWMPNAAVKAVRTMARRAGGKLA